MKFLNDQVIEVVKTPKNSGEVIEGRNQESRLRLLTEKLELDELKSEKAWDEFRSALKKRLSADKANRVEEYIELPLSAVSITESLMSDIYKVFDAGNSFFSVESVKESGGDKLKQILGKIDVSTWIENQGKEILKNKPNTVIVIDKDEEGNPYPIAIDNDRIHDIMVCEDGVSIEYICFIHSIEKTEGEDEIKRYALYDEEMYHVVTEIKGNFTLEKSIKHGLEECPARMFVTKRLNSKSQFKRNAPLSSVVSKLKEWQYFDIFKFFTDHYAPFPVTEMMRGKCQNDNCEGGFIYSDIIPTTIVDGVVGEQERRKVKCPQCEAANTIGVGTKILLDAVDEGEDSAAGKFKFISPATENLKYIQEKLDYIEEHIKNKVVGIDQAQTKEAINEKQVMGSFESRTNVLLRTKKNLDEVYIWIVSTIASMLAKKGTVTVNANFGTEWYLISEDDIQTRYDMAKKSGMPASEINEIYLQLIDTKYKGNPVKIERLKIINMIDPCAHQTMEQKIVKYEKSLISQVELIISEKLIMFVNRFEMENGNIVNFGVDKEPRDKYKNIVEQFKLYANEYIKENDTQQA